VTAFHALVLLPPPGAALVGDAPALLCPVLGRTPLGHVIAAARDAGAVRVTVLADLPPAWESAALAASLESADLVRVPGGALASGGAGGSLARLRAALAASTASNVLVLDAAAARLSAETLRRLVALHLRERAAATRLGGAVGAAGAERACVCVLAREPVTNALERRRAPGGDLDDLFVELVEAGHVAASAAAEDPGELTLVTSAAGLSAAATTLRERRNRALLAAGVLIEDPASTWIDVRAAVAPGARLRPSCVLEGRSSVGPGAEIGPFVRLLDTAVGAGAQVLDHCLLRESVIEEGAVIGPFAHLRPLSRVRRGAKVGNFVELKKTDLGEGSKAPHLSYLGDATIGPKVNVGAGTITCNYDGAHKHPTHIEAGAFIGSDTTLVAPVRVGAGAYVGAGSTITDDVPADALALGRARQVTKPGWAARKRALDARKL
jgi:bifunctional UDP-N-acetylglucosamine pyrophosphorylase/glucosamine-1-phosphate N-acetyltransferase